MSDLRSYVENPSSPGDNSDLVDTSEKRNDSDNANKTPAG